MIRLLDLVLIGAFMMVLFACEKEEVSSKHELTEEEKRIRDSIEAAKKAINADHILAFNITLPRDSSAYRSIPVVVPADSILAQFPEYATAEELNLAFGAVDAGAQYDNEIDFFAINSSTGFDYTAGFTANGFGHWFDNNGDVITWGDNSYMFSEFDPESLTFFIGQFPNRLATGEKRKIVQMMEKDDHRVAFIFNVTVGEHYVEVVPELSVVATQSLSLQAVQNNAYESSPISIDYVALATSLGVDTATLSADYTLYGFNADGTYTSAFTANAGYWFTNTGNVINWGGAGVTLFVEYSAGQFTVGQFPDAAQIGETYNVSLAVAHTTSLKAVKFNIAYSIIDYIDPEEPMEGDPVTLEKSYEVNRPLADGFTGSVIDVKDVLREAFKMTTYQIHKAIESGDLKFSGLNTDGSVYVDAEGNPASTAAHPGHWYALNGNVTVWGDEAAPTVVYSELKHTNETLNFAIGHHPDIAKAGDVVTYKQIAELNGGKVTFTFNVTIE